MSTDRYRIIVADQQHVAAVAGRVRESDRRELWAAFHQTPAEVMTEALRSPGVAWVGLADDLPLCLFGAAPDGTIGRPWMVATVDMSAHALPFLALCRPVVSTMLDLFPVLENWVAADNKEALTWLRWLGFELCESSSMGPDGVEFTRFRMVGT